MRGPIAAGRQTKIDELTRYKNSGRSPVNASYDLQYPGPADIDKAIKVMINEKHLADSIHDEAECKESPAVHKQNIRVT
jgi:hypothetical protein